MTPKIEAWDIWPYSDRPVFGSGCIDGLNNGKSHGFVRDDPTYSSLHPACGRGGWLHESARRLQPHVPELPLCPDCARIAGLPTITGVTA